MIYHNHSSTHRVSCLVNLGVQTPASEFAIRVDSAGYLLFGPSFIELLRGSQMFICTFTSSQWGHISI